MKHGVSQSRGFGRRGRIRGRPPGASSAVRSPAACPPSPHRPGPPEASYRRGPSGAWHSALLQVSCSILQALPECSSRRKSRCLPIRRAFPSRCEARIECRKGPWAPGARSTPLECRLRRPPSGDSSRARGWPPDRPPVIRRRANLALPVARTRTRPGQRRGTGTSIPPRAAQPGLAVRDARGPSSVRRRPAPRGPTRTPRCPACRTGRARSGPPRSLRRRSSAVSSRSAAASPGSLLESSPPGRCGA